MLKQTAKWRQRMTVSQRQVCDTPQGKLHEVSIDVMRKLNWRFYTFFGLLLVVTFPQGMHGRCYFQNIWRLAEKAACLTQSTYQIQLHLNAFWAVQASVNPFPRLCFAENKATQVQISISNCSIIWGLRWHQQICFPPRVITLLMLFELSTTVKMWLACFPLFDSTFNFFLFFFGVCKIPGCAWLLDCPLSACKASQASVCFSLCPVQHSNWCACWTRLFTWTHAGIKACWYGTVRWFCPWGTANETGLKAAVLSHLARINRVEQPFVCCNQPKPKPWFICALAVLDMTKHNCRAALWNNSGKICNVQQNFTFNSSNQKHPAALHFRQLCPYMKKYSDKKSVLSLPWDETYKKNLKVQRD